jgi:hypothetical protein
MPKTAKRQVTAKPGKGNGLLHVGQTLYGLGNSQAVIQAIDGDDVTLKIVKAADHGMGEKVGTVIHIDRTDAASFTSPQDASANPVYQGTQDDALMDALASGTDDES